MACNPSPHPLFVDRRADQCAWPLWADSTPAKDRRVCGNPVKADSKIPYCVEHLEAQRGKGAPVERSAIRPARSLIAKGA